MAYKFMFSQISFPKVKASLAEKVIELPLNRYKIHQENLAL